MLIVNQGRDGAQTRVDEGGRSNRSPFSSACESLQPRSSPLRRRRRRHHRCQGNCGKVTPVKINYHLIYETEESALRRNYVNNFEKRFLIGIDGQK